MVANAAPTTIRRLKNTTEFSQPDNAQTILSVNGCVNFYQVFYMIIISIH